MIKVEPSRLLKSRFSPLLIAVSLICLLSFITRVALLIDSRADFDWSVFNLLKVFLIGFVFDLSVAVYITIPLVLFLWVFPSRYIRSKLYKILLLAYFCFIITAAIFNMVSEWFFWEEFSVRYNFIAVDYLIYTTEVIGNIRQSYPINTIIISILVLSAVITFGIRKTVWQSTASAAKFLERSPLMLLLLCLPIISYYATRHSWKNFSTNQYMNELAGNGMYDFGYAFWNNELDYNKFYKTMPLGKATELVQQQLGVPDTLSYDYTNRLITAPAPERKMNVVLISVESLSAEFMGAFGNQKNITPNLDSLGQKGMLFTKLYASGTRTVRGLEALSLCIPPTPGQSIIKRQNNKGMFTLGSVFRDKGYSTRFIYGGYSYFDNMKEFFSNNGYTVTDREEMDDQDIHYQNAWGIADEDLFTLSMRKIDADYDQKKPFFAHIMTVSNHRPYTYPEGRIDIPSHTGREGAVKYTDYAIGKFIRDAAHKPWFSNTLFVIVADHCASSAGKVELPVDKYHIPMILYAPGFIHPGKFDKLTAQIDIGPSILGLLNFNYKSKFFGQDIFKVKPGAERIFISTYQSLGYIKNNQLIILDPNKKASIFRTDLTHSSPSPMADNTALMKEAIANYQLASEMYRTKAYQDK